AKLVPTLNKLNGSTLFAPTNDAIERHRKETSKSAFALALDGDESQTLADNVQEVLRQDLFYHLLNYTLDSVPEQLTPQLTLHFPALPLEPPTGDPPPSPPWLPVPGGLLGGEPQRLRTTVRDGASYIGVDSQGQGGAKAVKDLVPTANGNIYGIDRVLDTPRDLFHEVSSRPGLATISRLLPEALKDVLTSTPHLTLFFPTDEAWKTVDPIEMRYLESGFAEQDMAKIVGLHASGTGSDGHGSVGWSENWRKSDLTNFTTLEGHKVRVNISEDGSATVSGRTIIEQDIYAANGVLHTVDSLLLNPDIFQLNAEKYLLALNATSFVALLRAANLSHYVDDRHDGQPWTILAPRDDVFTLDGWKTSPLPTFSLNDGEDKPPVNITELQRVLKYHIIPGKLKPGDLDETTLVGTELREEGLGGERQVVEVSVHGSGKNGRVERKGDGEIGFGGALVIGEAVEINDCVIYVLSKPLTPPTDVIEAALPFAHFSTFLTSAFATHMDDVLRISPSTTVLIPHNSAWSPLGLLTDYLLLPESREHLANVVRHHVLKEVVYPGDPILSPKSAASKTFATLEGSDVRMEHGKITGSGGWSAPLRVLSREILTRTGVIHELEGGLLIPRSVQVNIGDLAMAGKGSIMMGLVQKAGFGKVLNGTMKLDLDEWEHGLIGSPVSAKSSRNRKKGKGQEDNPKPRKEEVGWTLMCPRDEAFKGVNLTRMLEDTEGLKTFVRQHLIPVPASSSSESWEYLNRKPRAQLSSEEEEEDARPIPVEDEATYSTLLSANSLYGDIVFRLTGSNVNSYLVGIKGAKGKGGAEDFARVLKWGRTTITSSSPPATPPSNSTGSQSPFESLPSVEWDLLGDRPTTLRSGVILIDRPLIPFVEGWWMAWGQAVTFGTFASFAIMGGWTGVVMWWRRKESEATYEPIGGHDDE
ncbi:hypothetical protein M407DRAFT_22026, partial [Tulasnella calospora MUT 4182]